MKGYHRITYTERLIIEKHFNSGQKVVYIAAALCRPVQTIYRELKNGFYMHLNSDYTESKRYSADIAQERASFNSSNHGRAIKLGRDFKFQEYVTRAIRSGWSPDVIVGRLRRAGSPFKTSVCTATLYSYIHKGFFADLSDKDLIRSKKRKESSEPRAKRAPAGISIEKRPQEVAARTSFGHWEFDTVVGNGKKGEVLLVLTERYSRFEIIKKMPDKSALSTINALRALRQSFGDSFYQTFKSFTCDNGCEFAAAIHKSPRSPLHGRVPVYYCHPYSAYERGSNENCNAIIRRFVKKGSRIERYSTRRIANIQRRINDMPRKVLGYATAREVFTMCLSSFGICPGL